jgi:hypothetical protein
MMQVDAAVVEALKKLLEAVEHSQANLIEQAALNASQISDTFDAQLRLDPAFLHQQITL